MHVLADLCVWYQKLRVGGWMAGHDLRSGKFDSVIRAYELFLAMTGITESYQTKEYYPSFAVRKG